MTTSFDMHGAEVLLTCTFLLLGVPVLEAIDRAEILACYFDGAGCGTSTEARAWLLSKADRLGAVPSAGSPVCDSARPG